MKHSTERILTTHVGSLPRPPDLLAMIQAKEQGEPFEGDRYASRVKSAVAEVVKKQADAGIDVLADGEMGRFGFIPYVNERLAGIEPRKSTRGRSGWSGSREHLAFPEYYQWAAQMPGAAGRAPPTQWVCTGPISYRGRQALQKDIDDLKVALSGSPMKKPSCRRSRQPTSPTGTPTNITRPTRSFGWPWPRRCTKNTGRSSMPASSYRSMIL